MNDLIAVQVNEQEEQYMNQIIESKGANLPDKIDDIVRVFEFTNLKAKAFKLLSDTALRLEEQNELYHSALRSSQKWSISSLYTQKRMGEITREIKPEYKDSGDTRYPQRSKNGISEGIYKQSEQIASHPEILEQVIEHAQKTDEVPTKTAVLKAIRENNIKNTVNDLNKKNHDKQIKKRLNEVDNQVKIYLDTIKGFSVAIDYAIFDAKEDKFSPESKNFIVKKHNDIIKKMRELESII